MGAYNFKPQFEEAIMADRKRHTIRAKRRHPDSPGNLLSLFVGMRTKNCRLLKRRRCVRVQSILIYERADGSVAVVLDNVMELGIDEKEALAVSDGFTGFGEMSKFWLKTHAPTGLLDFEGDLIHWESDAEARPYQSINRYQRFQKRRTTKPTVVVQQKERQS